MAMHSGLIIGLLCQLVLSAPPHQASTESSRQLAENEALKSVCDGEKELESLPPSKLPPIQLCDHVPGADPVIIDLFVHQEETCKSIPHVKFHMKQGDRCKADFTVDENGRREIHTYADPKNKILDSWFDAEYGRVSLQMDFDMSIGRDDLVIGFPKLPPNVTEEHRFSLLMALPEEDEESIKYRIGDGNSTGRQKRSVPAWIEQPEKKRYSEIELDYDPDERVREIFEDVFARYGDEDQLYNSENPYIAWLKRADSRKKRAVEAEEEASENGVKGENEDEGEERNLLAEKRGNWERSGMQWLKRGEPSKKSWAKSGMQWIKRGEDLDDEKRSWAKSGMQWIKRGQEYEDMSDAEKRSWAKSGMQWIKRGQEDEGISDAQKRSWAKSGMQWIKRGEDLDDEKRSWAKSGMQWIKRDGELANEAADKRSWAKSGMHWIKKALGAEPEKRSWAKSGMQWIKRNNEVSDGEEVGEAGGRQPIFGVPHEQLSDVEAGNSVEKKSKWAKANMSWLKRSEQGEEPEKRGNWAKSGMRWIRSPRSWDKSGMRWIRSEGK